MSFLKTFILALFLASGLPVFADNDINELITQLGAAKYKERKKAEQALWELLPDSEDALRKAAQSNDPEVNTRAKRILEKYEKGILPGISEEVKQKIDTYWSSDKKATYIRDWIYGSEFKDIPTIITLLKLSERKGMTILIQELLSNRDFFSTLYLKYRNTRHYEYFVRKYAEQGNKEIYLNWVSTSSDPLKELKFYESKPNTDDDNIKSLKQSLYKLSGNQQKAEELVKGDLKEELALLIQKKEYKKILENPRLIQSTQAIGEEKFKILFQRLSGDKEAYKLAKQVMIDEYGSKVYKTFHLNTLHALMANGEVDDAAKIAKELVPLWYTRILSLKGNLKDITEFGNENNDSRSASYVAYEMSKLFKKEDCIKWLEKVKLTDLDDRWLYYYTKAYVYAYGVETAFDHVIENIENIQSNSRYQLYYALCPAFSTVASYLIGYKKEDIRENFILLKKFILKRLKGEDLNNFYSKVSFNNGRISESKIRVVYDSALYLEDEEKLKSFKDEYLKNDRNKLREAQRLLLDEKYEDSLKILDSIKLKDVELKLYLFIRARCFEKLGQKEKYEEELKLLKNSPTWSYELGYGFIDLLDDFEEKDLLAYFLSQFQYSSSVKNSKFIERLIKYNLEIGDTDQAQYYSIQYYLNRSKDTLYLYPLYAQRLYLNFLKVEYDKNLQSKKIKDAVETAEKFLELSPHYYEFHVHVTNSLKKSGQQKESDSYFAKYMKLYEDQLELSPMNSTAMNDWAWSAALCDRKLDEAEKKARKAVELDSENANLWDTLAEVLFRKGQVKDAVKMQQKACDLTDPQRYSTFRAKLSKFKGTLK
ncbi:MAG: hypothetical protein NE327_15855 [Lentisphaeraceae bacterium]|nr:hypothetical protein [Lentisphaeraceae bacterium]